MLLRRGTFVAALCFVILASATVEDGADAHETAGLAEVASLDADHSTTLQRQELGHRRKPRLVSATPCSAQLKPSACNPATRSGPRC